MAPQHQVPLALVTETDELASWAVLAAERVGLHVPDDVGIVGVNNDELTCEFCPTPLSSLAFDFRQIGYHAAQRLDVLMHRPEQESLTPTRLPPQGVVMRRSTDTLASGEPALSRLLRTVRDGQDLSLSLQTLLDMVPMSRRTLERRFREHLGQTPAEYLRQLKIRRAMQVLGSTEESILAIAMSLGYKHLSQFSRDFRHVTGISPTGYRRQSGR